MTFLRIFRKFLKIFQNCSEGQTNISKHFPNISEYFLKITGDCRGLQKTTKDNPKMFRSYINKFKCTGCLRDKRKVLSKMVSPHVMISYCFYRGQFNTTPYFTGVYIIKVIFVFNVKEVKCRWKSQVYEFRSRWK